MLLAIAKSTALSNDQTLLNELLDELKPLDLWWDDASYIRYQSGEEYDLPHLYYELTIKFYAPYKDAYLKAFPQMEGFPYSKTVTKASSAKNFAFIYRKFASITIRKCYYEPAEND